MRDQATALFLLGALLVAFTNCSSDFQSSSYTPSSIETENPAEGEPATADFHEIGLAALYDFAEKTGVGSDSSGFDDQLILKSAPIDVGPYGNELVLDGQTSSAETENFVSLPANSRSITLSAVARSSTDATGSSILLSLGAPEPDKGIWLGRVTKDLQAGFYDGNFIEVKDFFGESRIGEYSLYSVTYDGLTLKLYVDGELKGSLGNKNFSLDRKLFRIGRHLDETGQHWFGAVAAVRAYERALSANEIAALAKLEVNRRVPLEIVPINGAWTPYGAWSGCPSSNCMTISETRVRHCSHPKPSNGGVACEGGAIESRSCPIVNCPNPTPCTGMNCPGSTVPVDGGWTNFGSWSACSKTCGGGIQTRTRTCTMPVPSNGGKTCVGSSSEQMACNTQACPTPTPTPSATPKPSATPSPTPTPSATPKPSATPSATPTPVPSATPSPTPAPVPPATPPTSNTARGGTIKIDHIYKQAENDALKALMAAVPYTNRSIKSGAWSTAATWEGGRIPATGANVLIGQNHVITYDVESSARIGFVRIDGELHFAVDRNTKLIVDTLVATPGSSFSVGSLASPVRSGVKAEIVIADNGPIDIQKDPKQLGRGVLLQGKVQIHGLKKKAYLSLDLPAANGRKFLGKGAAQIKLKGDTSNWSVGDEIIVMGTVKGAQQDEARLITAINGSVVTLNAPLAFDHDTPSFQTNNVAKISELNIYVGNLTRNVVFRSEYSSYVDVKRRGHVMIMYADGADVRYAGFHDLGRTDKRVWINDAFRPGTANPDGRYPLYFHMTGVGEDRSPFAAIGNAVTRSPGWGLVQQDSYGAVNFNFVYDIIGAGIVSEAGNEVGEWIGNFVSRIPGHANGRKVNQIDVQYTGDTGWAGTAYECQSRMLLMQKNIAANAEFGWGFLGIKGARGHVKGLPDNSPEHLYIKTPMVVSTRDPRPQTMQYVERPGMASSPMNPQFVNFNENESIALNTGVNSWHRLRPFAFELLNNIHGHIAWRTGQAFNFINYVGGYHISDSLMVDVGVVLKAQEKTQKNSLVRTHIERVSDSMNSGGLMLNYAGVLYGNTEVNVTNPFNNSTFPSSQYGGTALKNVGPQSLVVFDSYPKVTQVGNVTKRTAMNVRLMNTPSIGPKQGLVIKGYVDDTFFTRTLYSIHWISGPEEFGPDMKINTADDKLKIPSSNSHEVWSFAGTRPDLQPLIAPGNGFGAYSSVNSLLWSEILDVYGVIKKNGAWVMPIPLWINDNFDGHPYPHLIDVVVVGANEADLLAHQLQAYPTVDLVGVSVGNPNVNNDGSFKKTRTYYMKNWRVAVPNPNGD